MKNNNQLKWQLSGAWNRGFEEIALKRQQRQLTPRNYLWATDLGKAKVDVYLKMMGTAPTNPPDLRALRKFEAGNMFEENVIKNVLLRSGILKSQQKHVSYKYPGLLKVTGRLDFLAGGIVDVKKAVEVINNEYSHLPETTKEVLIYTVEDLERNNPDGLEPLIIELKTCSLSMFNYYEKIKSAGDNHKLQTFHYLKGMGMPEGHIVYLCRDDMRLAQYGVFNPSGIEDSYKNFIEDMTVYINTQTRPEIESLYIWDVGVCKFKPNWKVMYSEYLTMLYGFEHQEAFRTQIELETRRMNSALKRLFNGDKITKLNEESLNLIEKLGWDIKDLIKQISINDIEEETTEEIDLM